MPSQELISQARRHVRTLRANPPEISGDPAAIDAFTWLLDNFSTLLLPADPASTSGHFPLDALKSGSAVRRKSWPPARRVQLKEVTGWGVYLAVSNGLGTPSRLDWKPAATDLAAGDWELAP